MGNSTEERISRLEVLAHEPYDFGHLVERLERIEGHLGITPPAAPPVPGRGPCRKPVSAGAIDLPAALPIVERAVAEYTYAMRGVSTAEDYATYCNTGRSAKSALELVIFQIGACIGNYGDVTSVSLAGVRSTSTQDLGGALRNWLTAARKKLATAAHPFNPHGSGPVPIEARES